MTETCEGDAYEEASLILESQAKASLKVLGRNKQPGVDGKPRELFQATETESFKVLTRICQQIEETKQWPTE